MGFVIIYYCIIKKHFLQYKKHFETIYYKKCFV